MKTPTIVLGVIGSDCHCVGNKILDAFFSERGYRVVNLGVMVGQDEFIDAAIESAAVAILISSLYGHAEIDCGGFRARCIERGLDDILLYIGGNLVVGKLSQEAIEHKFTALGFDRVFLASDAAGAGGKRAQAPDGGGRRRARAGAGGAGRRITLALDARLRRLAPEGYTLEVAPRAIVLRAPAPAGIFYGIQTLRQLLPPEIFREAKVAGVEWTVPAVRIDDQPRFSWRASSYWRELPVHSISPVSIWLRPPCQAGSKVWSSCFSSSQDFLKTTCVTFWDWAI